MISVLFVCMGNICRSPTAEGVFRKMVADSSLAGKINIDSAGTHGYHVGAPPDARAIEHAAKRGYDLSALRCRQVNATDLRVMKYPSRRALVALGEWAMHFGEPTPALIDEQLGKLPA